MPPSNSETLHQERKQTMATSDHTASDTAACRKPLCEAFRFTTIVVLVLSFAGFTCDAILAQGYLAQGGNPTFNTATPVELGFVNAANGNLHLEIPLSSFPQRGSRGLSARLVYDSRIWKVVTSLGNQSWQP